MPNREFWTFVDQTRIRFQFTVNFRSKLQQHAGESNPLKQKYSSMITNGSLLNTVLIFCYAYSREDHAIIINQAYAVSGKKSEIEPT